MAHPNIEQFQRVLKMDPQDETLWFGLGKAHMSDENWTDAVEALDQCLEVKPTYSAAYFALAQSLQQLQDVKRCREVCEKGIAVATENGDLMVIKNLETLRDALT